MTETIFYPVIGNHIMSSIYANNSYDGFASPSIGNDGGVLRRGILKYTLPNSILVSVSTLSLKPKANASSETYAVYRIKKNITNAITWNKFDGSTPWDTAGGYSATDIDTTALGTFTGSVTQDVYFNISLNTTEILKMMNGTYQNYGFLIKNSEAGTFLTYYNYNDATVTNRPKLFLNFVEPSNGESISMLSTFGIF